MMMNEDLLARILTRLEGIQAALDRAEHYRMYGSEAGSDTGIQMFTCYNCADHYFATEEQMINHLRTEHGSGGPSHRFMGAKHEKTHD